MRYLLCLWICIAVPTCPALSISNGDITYNKNAINGKYPVRTIASFSCDYGYLLQGQHGAYCLHSGNWDLLTPPLCKSNEVYQL